ncbi:MAG: hypothetical protein CVU43_17870 [Chloroflexi bacterium HGW-Chloroflexi-5]|jgi:ribulose-5-phosphate 4-epimerase/fuculose-1-phosphate aldolase|nr:MAG: hypothetical protein CVU54_11135 [Deltaproteobacteria bacterium HGW-Deltaproteobacteria-12]PKN97059.1 MAG: hypothetical protein CVU43_17870 [Chloroflexi bacterium HGW-Chloroflexi-5]
MAKYEKFKKNVLEASLWLSEKGYFGSHRGTGGNVSVRVTESAMAITPSSVKYQDLKASDICVVGFDHEVIEGKMSLKPSVESGLHAIIYQKRPDTNAVVHTHQLYGSVFAVMNMSIPPLFDDVAFSLGTSIDVIPYALSGSSELAHNVAGKLSNNANAYILQNHGILALGKTIEKAILHAELLEKVAHIYYLALSTGKPVSTLPESIVELVKVVRNHEVKES